MRLTRRRHATALLGAVAVGGLVSVGAPGALGRPAAAPCADPAGVTVVVDFGSAGGGVQTGCAPAPVASGFEALSQAGFPIRNVSSQPGFLCQIAGKPAGEPCNRVPSGARYWSYWHAQRGGAWIYSSSGASRTPPPGSVEGWSFGAGDPPGAPPPAPIATTTTSRGSATTGATSPAPTTTMSPAPATGATASTVSDDAGSTAGAVDGGSTTSSSLADGDAGVTGPDGDGEQAIVALDTGRASDGTGGGSPAGTVAAVAIVLLLGGAGAVTVRRRRRTEEAGP